MNSLTALGKLFTTNVHPLDPGVNGYLTKDSFYSIVPGIIVMAANGCKCRELGSLLKARGVIM